MLISRTDKQESISGKLELSEVYALVGTFPGLHTPKQGSDDEFHDVQAMIARQNEANAMQENGEFEQLVEDSMRARHVFFLNITGTQEVVSGYFHGNQLIFPHSPENFNSLIHQLANKLGATPCTDVGIPVLVERKGIWSKLFDRA